MEDALITVHFPSAMILDLIQFAFFPSVNLAASPATVSRPPLDERSSSLHERLWRVMNVGFYE